MKRRVLVCGGAGFIGSNLAVHFAELGDEVVCLDNLSRRGSERILARILEHGCRFVHGDLRNPEDLARTGGCDLIVECSAEPSVLVGAQGSDARFTVQNNLVTALNAFEHARVNRAGIVFLSTSRVYPYDALSRLPLVEQLTRFDVDPALVGNGCSYHGVAESFPMDGVRSLYGATKLAAELILREYSANYDVPAIVTRFGVVAGPWQLGKADQGIFTYWLAAHCFGTPLTYIGHGGTGKQLRDLLHIDDLVRLVDLQISRISEFRGQAFNAGGGRVANLSLCETTEICRSLTGNSVPIRAELANRAADVPWYVTDNTLVAKTFGWLPEKTGAATLSETYSWMKAHKAAFAPILNPAQGSRPCQSSSSRDPAG